MDIRCARARTVHADADHTAGGAPPRAAGRNANAGSPSSVEDRRARCVCVAAARAAGARGAWRGAARRGASLSFVISREAVFITYHNQSLWPPRRGGRARPTATPAAATPTGPTRPRTALAGQDKRESRNNKNRDILIMRSCSEQIAPETALHRRFASLVCVCRVRAVLSLSRTASRTYILYRKN